MVLVPGLIRGDVKAISNAVGVPTFKGPMYCADLPTVLDSLGKIELSTIIPADELLKEKLRETALAEIVKVEANRDNLLKKPGNILVGNLPVGKDFPMRVIGEIVDAALLSDEEIGRLARSYVADGADLIDLGMVAGESRPEDARRVVAAAKKEVKVPVSFDSLDPIEIRGAISAGADLILSIDEGNVKALSPLLSDVAVVVIPSNQRVGYFPKKLRNEFGCSRALLLKPRVWALRKF